MSLGKSYKGKVGRFFPWHNHLHTPLPTLCTQDCRNVAHHEPIILHVALSLPLPLNLPLPSFSRWGFALESRLASNSSSHLSLPGAVILGTHHHTQLAQCYYWCSDLACNKNFKFGSTFITGGIKIQGQNSRTNFGLVSGMFSSSWRNILSTKMSCFKSLIYKYCQFVPKEDAVCYYYWNQCYFNQ